MPKGPMPRFKKPVDTSARSVAVGIDASLTSTGLVALDIELGTTIAADTIRPPGSGVLRLVEIQAGVARWFDQLMFGHSEEYRVVHVCMEGYGFDGLNSHQASIGEGGGAIKLALYRGLKPPVCFPSLAAPSQLKKFVTGKGVGSKDQMRLEVYKRWGFEHKSNDVVDAYGLAQLARALVKPTAELIVPQRDVLKSMRLPSGKNKKGPPGYHAEMPIQMRYELAV